MVPNAILIVANAGNTVAVPPVPEYLPNLYVLPLFKLSVPVQVTVLPLSLNKLLEEISPIVSAVTVIANRKIAPDALFIFKSAAVPAVPGQ